MSIQGHIIVAAPQGTAGEQANNLLQRTAQQIRTALQGLPTGATINIAPTVQATDLASGFTLALEKVVGRAHTLLVLVTNGNTRGLNKPELYRMCGTLRLGVLLLIAVISEKPEQIDTKLLSDLVTSCGGAEGEIEVAYLNWDELPTAVVEPVSTWACNPDFSKKPQRGHRDE